jgi:hypothetical protein
MCNDNGYKEVYSLSQFARILGISRTSLYQYKETGVFPPSLSCPCMDNRPFYTHELLQRCLTILKTGIDYSGKAVVFNARRKPRTARGRVTPKKTRADLYQSLTKIMKQIGIDVTIDEVKGAIKTVCPKGLVINNEPEEKLIKAVYGHFMVDRENSVRKT